MLIKNFLSALFFYLVITPLSLLPLPILYGFSSGLFYITYYLFPYRKKVVLENLKFAFPDLSQNDRNAIAKKFFRHFIDLLIETIKVFSISEDEFKQRVKVANPDFAKPEEDLELNCALQKMFQIILKHTSTKELLMDFWQIKIPEIKIMPIG